MDTCRHGRTMVSRRGFLTMGCSVACWSALGARAATAQSRAGVGGAVDVHAH